MSLLPEVGECRLGRPTATASVIQDAVHIGVVFPGNELPTGVGALRRWAQRVEELGFSHILAYDHVVGADPAVHTGWTMPQTVDSPFREPFVLFGYLAALTTVELVTGIVILPQRQTVLVAKQAAEIDLLSAGRFRLGVGLGWNKVEYEALGQDFSTRGRRMGEQVELLRRLWTERTVTFEGSFDRVTGVGVAPLPVQRPIPLWFGAASPAAYRRTGRLADGWFPAVSPGRRLEEARAVIDAAAIEAGRDPSTIGMEARIDWGAGAEARLVDHATRWQRAGASHLAVNTVGGGLEGIDGHLDALARVANALGVTPKS